MHKCTAETEQIQPQHLIQTITTATNTINLSDQA